MFLTVVVVSPVIVILIPRRQSPPLLLCSLGGFLVGLVEPPVLPGADVGRELCALGGLEGSDRIMRRDMRRVVRRAELGGSGVVEGVGEFLAGGDVEHFSEFGALGDTYGWSSLFVSSMFLIVMKVIGCRYGGGGAYTRSTSMCTRCILL